MELGIKEGWEASRMEIWMAIKNGEGVDIIDKDSQVKLSISSNAYSLIIHIWLEKIV